MKKRKWVLPVCIVCGGIILCIAGLLIAAGVMSSKGYGISIGRLYFSDAGTYLIDKNDSAMLVSDQSTEQKLFSGYASGDKVFLIHGGVNECYPAWTGGYHMFRLVKGDGTYKPDDDVIGVETITQAEWHDRDAYLLGNAQNCKFDAQYIRTNGYHEGIAYPVVRIIRSVNELKSYYNEYQEMYSLERRENPASDFTIGFLDACDKYTAAYFENQILVMVILEEGSGSTRHTVESVGTVEQELVICIDTIVPETGTCDMAEWHILIELESGVDVEDESAVTVFMDGVNPHTQSTTVRNEKESASITLSLPYGWEYETVNDDDSDTFSIDIWPAGQTEGKLSVKYFGSHFGVCGTGLEEKKIILGEYEAYQGTYDNAKMWDFISLIGTSGAYVVINEGADNWWNEYGDEAMQILNTLVVGENISDEGKIVDIEYGE